MRGGVGALCVYVCHDRTVCAVGTGAGPWLFAGGLVVVVGNVSVSGNADRDVSGQAGCDALREWNTPLSSGKFRAGQYYARHEGAGEGFELRTHPCICSFIARGAQGMNYGAPHRIHWFREIGLGGERSAGRQ